MAAPPPPPPARCALLAVEGFYCHQHHQAHQGGGIAVASQLSLACFSTPQVPVLHCVCPAAGFFSCFPLLPLIALPLLPTSVLVINPIKLISDPRRQKP